MSFLDQIKRPTLLLDERKCRENIRMMADKARRSNVIFRPHFKSHQSAAIGEWYREEGVTSITVSSVGMACYFADAGWNDFTVAFPVNLRELDEIDRLAGTTQLNLVVNSPDTLRILDKKLRNQAGIFIEIDTGYHRSGLPPSDLATIERIIRGCQQSWKLRFQGFLSHFGESYHATGTDEIENIYHHGIQELQKIQRHADPEHRGIISVGDTPSCSVLEEFPGADEIRPGNFLFYDVMQLAVGACTTGQISLCLAAPLVDLYPERSEAVVYAGAIHLSKESIISEGQEIFGLVVQLTGEGWSDPLEGCTVTSISQEHGILRLDHTMMEQFHPGDLIGILPVHACLTADAMKRYLTIHGKPVSMFNGI